MSDYRAVYELWANGEAFDKETRDELLAISNDDKEIEERFFRDLEFGTGGLRGILGAGTNRMNIYTVRRASQGMADYILANEPSGKGKGVVIAHDSRRYSKEFAEQSALIFAQNGIKAYLFESLRPTPLLSYSILQLGCIAGIVITASHNPKEYNGYKAYWAHGGQITPPQDGEIINAINKISDFSTLKVMDYDEAVAKGLLTVLDGSIDDKYIDEVLSCSHADEATKAAAKGLQIVYTPLNGAGNVFVRRALQQAGFEAVHIVPEQEMPDPDFTTAPYPNPEDSATWKLALELAKNKNADIIIATDPDCDRTGVMAKDGDTYRLLSGNQTGVLFAHYILSSLKNNGKLPNNTAIVSTIVSTKMTEKIASAFGTSFYEVLTGFKYIGEKITAWEQSGQHTFILGFEESIGFLCGRYARDKDGVAAALLIAEVAAHYAARGLTLFDGLNELYDEYGYFIEGVKSLTFKGMTGLKDMERIMAGLRDNPPSDIGGRPVLQFRDYKLSLIDDLANSQKLPIDLPKSDVLYFVLDDGWFCIRPSGTEPKIKIYFGVSKDTKAEAEAALASLTDDVMAFLAI